MPPELSHNMETPPPHTVSLRYFAWVREKTGVAEEQLTLPDSLVTVADLMAWLASRDEGFAAAFAEPRAVRVALDHAQVKPHTPIGAAREIAFFPPMTGG
jgi:sulfur-carrier protein